MTKNSNELLQPTFYRKNINKRVKLNQTIKKLQLINKTFIKLKHCGCQKKQMTLDQNSSQKIVKQDSNCAKSFLTRKVSDTQQTVASL